MRSVVIGFGLVGLAFLVGVTGAPGQALAAAAGWLEDHDRIELRGPVGDAVREAF
jgi:hypothetical protein